MSKSPQTEYLHHIKAFQHPNLFARNFDVIEANHELPKLAQTSSLGVLHLNVRSFKKNSTAFTDFINALDFRFPFIAITELWLNKVKNLAFWKNCLDDYQPAKMVSRKEKNGGGVGLFVLNGIDYKVLPDVAKQLLGCESLWIEYTKNKNKSVQQVIGVIYRTENVSVSTFSFQLEKILDMFQSEDTSCVICGDTNIDLATTNFSNSYIQTVSLCGFRNLITAPTRITESSSTHIDHMFTNKLSTMLTAGTISCDVADHNSTYVVFHENIHFATSVKYETYWSKYNRERFLKNLKTKLDKTWRTHEQGVEMCVNDLLLLITEAISSQSENEYRVTKVTNKKAKKPWLTESLIKCISKQHSLYRKTQIQPTNAIMKEKHRKYKNTLTNALKTAKKLYHHQQLELLKKNPWQLLNYTLGRSKAKHNRHQLKSLTN
eukprot:Lithocolla_globosa_v1_NODE_136_length_5835_cov_11.826644.p1 type:complete len:433 gc:universal NODE_136_length_5835_cov_11.826644:1806-508(-)